MKSWHRFGIALAGAVAVIAVAARCAHAEPAPLSTSRALRLDSGTWLVQYVVGENQIVETVTCTKSFAHVDAQQYGDISGTTCQSTGLLQDVAANEGHVSVTFPGVMTATGCRVDSFAISAPGFVQVALTCIAQ